MYEKNYQQLKKEFDELNYTLFQKIYLEEFRKYITEPEEVKFLLNQMFESQLILKFYFFILNILFNLLIITLRISTKENQLERMVNMNNLKKIEINT